MNLNGSPGALVARVRGEAGAIAALLQRGKSTLTRVPRSAR